MRSSVIAFFLSACTAAAIGQCVAPTVAPVHSTAAPGKSTTVNAVRPAAPARPAPELITAAGAVTHDAPPVMQATAPRTARTARQDGERPRRAGPAMLLAALALMSGIALRRYSARDQ